MNLTGVVLVVYRQYLPMVSDNMHVFMGSIIGVCIVLLSVPLLDLLFEIIDDIVIFFDDTVVESITNNKVRLFLRDLLRKRVEKRLNRYRNMLNRINMV